MLNLRVFRNDMKKFKLISIRGSTVQNFHLRDDLKTDGQSFLSLNLLGFSYHKILGFL